MNNPRALPLAQAPAALVRFRLKVRLGLRVRDRVRDRVRFRRARL
jgi:hypothetical protein